MAGYKQVTLIVGNRANPNAKNSKYRAKSEAGRSLVSQRWKKYSDDEKKAIMDRVRAHKNKNTA